jgi:WD40 repeat protein
MGMRGYTALHWARRLGLLSILFLSAHAAAVAFPIQAFAISYDKAWCCVISGTEVQTVDLLRLIRSQKWDIGVSNTPFYVPSKLLSISNNRRVLLGYLTQRHSKNDASLSLWDGRSGALLRSFSVTNAVQRVAALSPGGSLAVGAWEESNFSALYCWSANSGNLVWKFRLDALATNLVFNRRAPIIWDARFSPNGRSIAVGTSDGIYLIQAATGHIERRLLPLMPYSYMTSLAWSANGKMIAAAGVGKVNCWRVNKAAPEMSSTVDGVISGLDLFSERADAAVATDQNVGLLNLSTGRFRAINNVSSKRIAFMRHPDMVLVDAEGAIGVLSTEESGFKTTLNILIQ